MSSDLPKLYLEIYNRVAVHLKDGKLVKPGNGPPPPTMAPLLDSNELVWWDDSHPSFREVWKESRRVYCRTWKDWFQSIYDRHPVTQRLRFLHAKWINRGTPLALIEEQRKKQKG